MIHSHIPVQHLIRQVEDLRARRGQRDARPAWVTQFIDGIADCFDPHSEFGRVGFECRPEDDAWTVTLYLGRTEIIGGPHDGTSRPTSFHFDVAAALKHFEAVQQLQWTARPTGDDANEESAAESKSAHLTIDGLVNGHRLRMVVMSTPPADAGPAFRLYPDGRCAPV